MSILNESTLNQFVQRNGYDYVKQIRSGKKKGQWRGISEASKRTGLSRPTVYAILAQHPEKPDKTRPKYMDKLEDSEGFKLVQQMYKTRITLSAWRNIVLALRRAVPIIGYDKDPVSWTEEDYKLLWYHPTFHNDDCKGIGKAPATAFHQLMRATNNHNLLAKFTYNNPPDGKKKNWYLQEPEILALIKEVQTRENLTLLFVGISTGARHSGLESITLEKIDFYDRSLEVYEQKVQATVTKFPPISVIEFLQTYCKDKKLKPSDKVFEHGYQWHLQRLREAGKRAGLNKKVSTHIMKHTFVTQAHHHGVSGSTIANQCGTEHRCLVKFYRAESELLLRNEMQGIEYNHEPFHTWINRLSYYFRVRYEQLKE